jgi:Galactose oxidase, central domain
VNAFAGTAAALAKDHWSTLPPAPIAARTSGASAWTGRQLLIWGGSYGSDGDQLGDGAAYAPATKRWTKLPAAPISARTQMASVWTGNELFVWGGNASDRFADNGALYNPTTMTWRMLPKSPLSARAGAQAVWVDGEVIVISGYPLARSTTLQVYTDLAAYSPTTNRWTTLAPMPLIANQFVLAVVAVATNDRLYAWEEWQHTTDDGGGASTTYSGIDLYIFDPTRNSWTPDVAASRPTDGLDRNNAPEGLESALWTGTDILVPPTNSNWCGDCPGPAILGGRGSVLDPSTNTWLRIPVGPIDYFGPGAFVWTGTTVIEFNTESETNGPGGSTLEGQAAAWDPRTGAWTRLPAAPLYGGDVAVWDGDELLEWGTLYVPTANNSLSSKTSGVQFGASG